MATNGVATQTDTKTVTQRRFGITISGLAIRLLIAFAISWFIVLVFFGTSVVSH